MTKMVKRITETYEMYYADFYELHVNQVGGEKEMSALAAVTAIEVVLMNDCKVEYEVLYDIRNKVHAKYKN